MKMKRIKMSILWYVLAELFLVMAYTSDIVDLTTLIILALVCTFSWLARILSIVFGGNVSGDS